VVMHRTGSPKTRYVPGRAKSGLSYPIQIQMAVEFRIAVFATILVVVDSVLPYIPALVTNRNYDRDQLVEQYFNLGLNYSEILAFLCVIHGIQLSLRQLKRLLFKKRLTRRKHHSEPDEVVNAVEKELSGSGKLLGYRLMHQRLRLDYGLVVSRETVRVILKSLDPESVARRSRNRLKRREYRSKGPNYIWHIDGYDKLKPFGFCIHGAIDGFSRRILWLEVGPSNNNPRVIATYFHDCIQELGGTPHICRSDRGTENVNVSAMQRFFRRNGHDEFRGEKSFMYGRSVSNQRIECWWAFLRKSEVDWWRSYFKDFRDQGLFDDTNPVHMECLKFCFMPLLQHELQRVAQHWNLHKIRPSSNMNSPYGRPDTIYFLPEINNTRSYTHAVPSEDLRVAKDTCCDVPRNDFASNFSELCDLIIHEKNLQAPALDVGRAERLYIDLLGYIEGML